MRLYAISVAAMHNGEPPSAIGVRTAIVALAESLSIEEAGMDIAREIFPEADGWEKHYVNPVEITQEFPLDPYRLVWQLEKRD